MEESALNHDRLAILSEIIAVSSRKPDVHMERARDYRKQAADDRKLATTFLRLAKLTPRPDESSSEPTPSCDELDTQRPVHFDVNDGWHEVAAKADRLASSVRSERLEIKLTGYRSDMLSNAATAASLRAKFLVDQSEALLVARRNARQLLSLEDIDPSTSRDLELEHG
ncbi:hypothetical protein A5695_13895 [Mycobacterium sp. E1747]|nr:hypothetical protein A5695_13895 [Mycobacterium sp. E1747]